MGGASGALCVSVEVNTHLRAHTHGYTVAPGGLKRIVKAASPHSFPCPREERAGPPRGLVPATPVVNRGQVGTYHIQQPPSQRSSRCHSAPWSTPQPSAFLPGRAEQWQTPPRGQVSPREPQVLGGAPRSGGGIGPPGQERALLSASALTPAALCKRHKRPGFLPSWS